MRSDINEKLDTNEMEMDRNENVTSKDEKQDGLNEELIRMLIQRCTIKRTGNSRLKKAADYQKKAIRALMPDAMEKHIDVIEKEMKSMFMELFVDMVKDRILDEDFMSQLVMGKMNTEASCSDSTKSSKTKKVTIQ